MGQPQQTEPSRPGKGVTKRWPVQAAWSFLVGDPKRPDRCSGPFRGVRRHGDQRCAANAETQRSAQDRTVAVLSTGMRPIHGDDAVRTAWCHQPRLPRPSAKRAPLRPAATSPFNLGRRLRGAKVPSPPLLSSCNTNLFQLQGPGKRNPETARASERANKIAAVPCFGIPGTHGLEGSGLRRLARAWALGWESGVGSALGAANTLRKRRAGTARGLSAGISVAAELDTR